MMTYDRPCSTRWSMTPIRACALKPSMFLSDLCSTANRKRPTPRRQCRQTVRKRLSRWNAWFAPWNNCSTGIPAVTCGCAAPRPYGKLALVKCSSRPEIVSTMNALFQPGPFSVARRMALLSVLAILFFLAPLTPPSWAAARTQPPDPGSQHAYIVRSGTMGTKDGLTLRLTTDLGSVNIIQLEAGAAPVVRYTVHIETDARGAAAQQLLDAYSLKAKAISSGVEITGMLSPQAVRSADAQFWVQFEVAVPRGYSIDRKSTRLN